MYVFARGFYSRFSKIKVEFASHITRPHEYSNFFLLFETAMSNDATLLHERNPPLPRNLRIPPHLEIDSVCYIGITTFHAPRGRSYPGNCREQWRYAGRCGVYPARRESFLIRPPRAFNRDRLLETATSSPRVRDRWLRILLTLLRVTDMLERICFRYIFANGIFFSSKGEKLGKISLFFVANLYWITFV